MHRQTSLKKILRMSGISIFFLFVTLYGVWRSSDLLFGINLSVKGIKNDQSFTDPILTLSGTARHATEINIDGRLVPVDQDGTWTDTIALLPGHNVVTVLAQDKFKKIITKRYSVYYVAPIANTPILPDEQTNPPNETNSSETPLTTDSSVPPDTPATQGTDTQTAPETLSPKR